MGVIDAHQFGCRWRLYPPAPGDQCIGRAAATSKRQDPAPLTQPVPDVPPGDIPAPRDKHQGASPSRQAVRCGGEPGRFVAPTLAGNQEKVAVVGIEGYPGLGPAPHGFGLTLSGSGPWERCARDRHLAFSLILSRVRVNATYMARCGGRPCKSVR